MVLSPTSLKLRLVDLCGSLTIMLWCLFEAASVLTVLFIVVCLVILARSDADLLTIYREKFGTKPESLEGKIVWVTGASSGIGEHIAYQLTAVGSKVILSARREEQLRRVKDACLASAKCKTKDEDIFILPLDVSKCETHKDAVQTALEKFGNIDILVNNAGRGMQRKWWDTDHGLKVDREIFDLNVFGTVSLTQYVLPHMLERRQGHIAVVGSVVGHIQVPKYSVYVATKHAIQGYFGSLRNELTDDNIDVTIICPGPVNSDFERAVVTASGEPLVRITTQDSMSSERCAYLSCVALANRMYESWISDNPALLVVYLNYYARTFSTWFMRKYSLRLMEKQDSQAQ